MVTLKVHHARDEPPFLAASPPGEKNPGLLEKATNWTRWWTPDAGNLMGGATEFTRTYTYVSAPGDARPRIPPPVRRAACANCGSGSDLTIEHCTPKWLADRLGSKPVTARVLCDPCNAQFKRCFEDPVSAMFAADTVAAKASRDIVSRWAAKTAAMLAHATYTQVPAAVSEYYRGTARDTVSVYCLDASPAVKQGYSFRVTKFEDKFNDAFLVSMAFGDRYFVVAHSQEPIGPIALLEQWYPPTPPSKNERAAPNDVCPADGAVTNIHEMILSDHFGITLTHENFTETAARTQR